MRLRRLVLRLRLGRLRSRGRTRVDATLGEGGLDHRIIFGGAGLRARLSRLPHRCRGWGLGLAQRGLRLGHPRL